MNYREMCGHYAHNGSCHGCSMVSYGLDCRNVPVNNPPLLSNVNLPEELAKHAAVWWKMADGGDFDPEQEKKSKKK